MLENILFVCYLSKESDFFFFSFLHLGDFLHA